MFFIVCTLWHLLLFYLLWWAKTAVVCTGICTESWVEVCRLGCVEGCVETCASFCTGDWADVRDGCTGCTPERLCSPLPTWATAYVISVRHSFAKHWDISWWAIPLLKILRSCWSPIPSCRLRLWTWAFPLSEHTHHLPYPTRVEGSANSKRSCLAQSLETSFKL